MQKNIFLKSEGDSWFERNKPNLDKADFSQDLIVREVKKILSLENLDTKNLLEVGCGNGGRLKYLNDTTSVLVHGVDPSKKAIDFAIKHGIDAVQATADDLPFGTATFDILVFGFCLYLCDREDLFRISAEADRVLKDRSWIVILDFYAKKPTQNPYHHHPGVFSYKMDYSSLFSWHPNYSLFSHEVLHHSEKSFTDITEEHIAVSVLRKKVK